MEVNPTDGWVRVQPGVVNFDLQRFLRPYGAFYPPNPGSWETSTVGGNAATNASGFRSFRYGPTRSWVLRARVVLGTGELVEVGTLAAKRSAGPELLALLVGSEGTLGIFTELTLRLAPLPSVRRGLLAPVPSGTSLGRVAAGLRTARSAGLSALEWIDARVARELSDATPHRWPVGPGGALLMEVEGGVGKGEGAADWVRPWTQRLRAVGIPGPLVPFDDADLLWRERGKAGRVLDERVGPRVREDVAVPLSRFDALLAGMRRVARSHQVELVQYAHLGEGSLHPNFRVPPNSPAADAVRRDVWAAAWRLGGTASAEHGLGRQKAAAFVPEHGPVVARVLRQLKRELDPDGVLNPGKLYG